ncbi:MULTISPECIES: hypothetical protein [Pedobacter]|uniref:Uncharacterized protein n=1 Tax=Pedobacter cryoconitis TaxID=188932 RepID=A0A327S4V5_9SPHI|nr:hypothetical protein [Pedobacter cryoconitis]RAJ22613.1 hypothetical protein LY11_04753 [Pedobacter cryoconitis]
MTIIKNIHPLSAEVLFDLLKKEFPDYINAKLDSMLNIDFTHVYHEINVLFPEVITGTALTITVSDQEITISDNAASYEFNATLLEEQLIAFIKIKAG